MSSITKRISEGEQVAEYNARRFFHAVRDLSCINERLSRIEIQHREVCVSPDILPVDARVTNAIRMGVFLPHASRGVGRSTSGSLHLSAVFLFSGTILFINHARAHTKPYTAMECDHCISAVSHALKAAVED